MRHFLFSTVLINLAIGIGIYIGLPESLAYAAETNIETTATDFYTPSQGPIATSAIPDDLTDWIPWVLDNEVNFGCSKIDNVFVCTWPSTIEFVLTETGGSFTQTVSVDRPRIFNLPGSSLHWPMHVRVDNHSVPVLNDHGTPTTMLHIGSHRIQGEFRWSGLPEGLTVPSDYALISLRINGSDVPVVQRDANGRVWLKHSVKEPESEDKFTLEVYRKISDGIPMMVTTNIVVRSSGKPNEVTLPNVQLDGTLPMNVYSELPARLDNDGALKLQTRGGTHQVEIVSIASNQHDAFTSHPCPTPWPSEEIWVFEPNDNLRQVELRGAEGIDPQRTNIKSEWQNLAAYSVKPDNTLIIRTIRRGESNPPPDQISLHRRIWLDMDGHGFTIADTMSGALHRASRLDMHDGQLGHVRVNGQDQVITANPKTQKAGVELRRNSFELKAESKMNRDSKSLRAVGWNADVQSLESTLYLPPGWDLITASGVDSIPGTWWDSWSLFAFFFVLLASIAAGKLTKWFFGVLTLVTLILLHNETDVEVLVGIGLPLLISLGLLKALPKGKFRIGVIIAWSIFALLMAAISIPFSVNQIREGLYPQLESEYYQPPLEFDAFDQMPAAQYKSSPTDDAPMEPIQEWIMDEKMDESAAEYEIQKEIEQVQENASPVEVRKKGSTAGNGLLAGLSSGSSRKWSGGNKQYALQQDPQAVVQTGPGIPSWEWNAFHLSWQGPVSQEQNIHLYLVGPTTKLILAILRVLLLALLAMILVLETFNSIRNPPSELPHPKRPKAKSVAATMGLLLLFSSQPAYAALPGSQMLDELRQKLTRPAPCEPACIDIPELHLSVANGTVNISAVVHAGADTTWTLPGPANNWIPANVLLDGREGFLSLQSNGSIHLKLSPGIHHVILSGPMKNESAFTLELTEMPHSGSITAAGYTVEGLREDGTFETSIALTQTIQADVTYDADADTGYTPWVHIERSLDLGIPWLIHTTVTRVSPPGSPLMLRIPLLNGENVTESELEVKGGAVTVALGRDDIHAEWSSTLKEVSVLTITAPKGQNWTETWNVKCSPIWQCTQSGIPPIQNGVDTRTYKPWPGEKLRIRTTRPKALPGQTATIDNAILNVSPGIRLTESNLSMDIRSSQGGIQTLVLPPKITIQQFTINGEKRPFKQKGKALEIALRPGKQKIDIQWQQQGGILNGFHAPRIAFGSSAANFRLRIEMPSDRWLLGVSGPSWGPAVLFWGYLLTILVVSFLILGRAKFSPLKGWQWALLTFGLTQVPIAVAIIIVGWFFLLSWRNSDPLKRHQWMWKNLLQVGIGIWTAAALFCLLGAVYNGLAVQPDMQVAGLDSSNHQLNWYLDRVEGQSPAATVWSVPILVWKAIMLAWSLWLAYSLIRWSKWGFTAYNEGGIWHQPPQRTTSATSVPVPSATVVAPEPSSEKDS